MTKRVVNDISLKSVADAIRERLGAPSSYPLWFPDGFVSAVEGIPDLLELRITDTLPEYVNTKDLKLKTSAFANCQTLVKLHLPNATGASSYVFQNCKLLSDVNFDKVPAFGVNAFNNCSALRRLSLPALTYIHEYMFSGCSSLETLILGNKERIVTLQNTNAFTGTPIASGTGYIYVPKASVNSYKSATNWSTYASQIRAIEDYPEISGG